MKNVLLITMMLLAQTVFAQAPDGELLWHKDGGIIDAYDLEKSSSSASSSTSNYFLAGDHLGDILGFVQAGKVHRFNAASGELFTYVSPTPADYGSFGKDIATYTNDDGEWLAIAAPNEPNSFITPGTVHIYLDNVLWNTIHTLAGSSVEFIDPPFGNARLAIGQPTVAGAGGLSDVGYVSVYRLSNFIIPNVNFQYGISGAVANQQFGLDIQSVGSNRIAVTDANNTVSVYAGGDGSWVSTFTASTGPVKIEEFDLLNYLVSYGNKLARVEVLTGNIVWEKDWDGTSLESDWACEFDRIGSSTTSYATLYTDGGAAGPRLQVINLITGDLWHEIFIDPARCSEVKGVMWAQENQIICSCGDQGLVSVLIDDPSSCDGGDGAVTVEFDPGMLAPEELRIDFEGDVSIYDLGFGLFAQGFEIKQTVCQGQKFRVYDDIGDGASDASVRLTYNDCELFSQTGISNGSLGDGVLDGIGDEELNVDIPFSFSIFGYCGAYGALDYVLCADGDVSYCDCGPDRELFNLHVDPGSDPYASDISVEVVDSDGSVLFTSACRTFEDGQPKDIAFCLDITGVSEIRFLDDFGDGWSSTASWTLTNEDGCILDSGTGPNNSGYGDNLTSSDCMTPYDLEHSINIDGALLASSCEAYGAIDYAECGLEPLSSCNCGSSRILTNLHINAATAFSSDIRVDVVDPDGSILYSSPCRSFADGQPQDIPLCLDITGDTRIRFYDDYGDGMSSLMTWELTDEYGCVIASGNGPNNGISGDGIDTEACDTDFDLEEEVSVDFSNCANTCDPAVAPVGITPTVVTTAGVTLEWQPIIDKEGCQIEGGQLFGSTTTITLLDENVSDYFIPSSTLGGGTHRWRVRCACKIVPVLVTTPFSTWYYFTPLSPRMAELHSVVPNPASDLVSVKWTAKQSGAHAVQLVDLAGRMMVEQEVTVQEGINELQLDIHTLAEGFYTLVLQDTQGMEIRESLVISR